MVPWIGNGRLHIEALVHPEDRLTPAEVALAEDDPNFDPNAPPPAVFDAYIRQDIEEERRNQTMMVRHLNQWDALNELHTN